MFPLNKNSFFSAFFLTLGNIFDCDLAGYLGSAADFEERKLTCFKWVSG